MMKSNQQCLVSSFLIGMVLSLNATSRLDMLGLKWGTDKNLTVHNYLRIYEKYFDSLKDKSINFLEIGFLAGGSARMWEEYFPQARLYFIDNHCDEITNGSCLCPRSSLHIVDQADSEALKKFADTCGMFDIIIDDGGHTMQQQIVSFITLFPYVKSGGLYCIEDLHTSYWPKFHTFISGKPMTTVQFLQRLIDDVNYIGHMTSMADQEKAPASLKAQCNEFQLRIESIHFYTSLCVIHKR